MGEIFLSIAAIGYSAFQYVSLPCFTSIFGEKKFQKFSQQPDSFGFCENQTSCWRGVAIPRQAAGRRLSQLQMQRNAVDDDRAKNALNFEMKTGLDRRLYRQRQRTESTLKPSEIPDFLRDSFFFGGITRFTFQKIKSGYNGSYKISTLFFLRGEPMQPFFPQKAIHYTHALAKWIKAGRPIRSKAEILHLLPPRKLSRQFLHFRPTQQTRDGNGTLPGGDVVTYFISGVAAYFPNQIDLLRRVEYPSL